MAGRDETFEQHRAELFGIAYRMLGTVADAEDVVQEAYLRWRSPSAADVRSPGAFLATVVTRLCLDVLGSARARRERYVGPWLPEPLLVDDTDPSASAELADSLSMAFLLLLEQLTPTERAAFLLHDVFAYSYEHISAALSKDQAACRQLVSRARRHLQTRRRHFDADRRQAEDLTRRFSAACATGDVQGLLDLLAEDVVVWTDGGGQVTAAPRPVVGATRAARFLVGVVAKLPAGSEVRQVTLNGQPGLVVTQMGRVITATVLDVVDGVITGVRAVVNPDKLAALTARLDVAPLP